MFRFSVDDVGAGYTPPHDPKGQPVAGSEMEGES